MSADEIIAQLGLQPHPEGGHYRQTWIAENAGRPAGTCIYFLLKAGERSHWHRVDATEIWHFYPGAPLEIFISETADGPAERHLLCPDLALRSAPQAIVPEGFWQSARSTGDYTPLSPSGAVRRSLLLSPERLRAPPIPALTPTVSQLPGSCPVLY